MDLCFLAVAARNSARHAAAHRWRVVSLALLSCLLPVSACKRSSPASAPLARGPSESSLGRVTLSKEAEQRLGIPAGLTALSQRNLAARRLLRGEVMAAPGDAAWVLAPRTGVVLAPPDGASLVPGARVRAGQIVALLADSLGPLERVQLASARIDADAQLARARAQDEATAQALLRAERLHAEQAIGTKVLEEARAQRAIAQAALQAAQAQRSSLAGSSAEGTALARSRSAQTALIAPLSGTVREVRVPPQAAVVSGAPLLEIVGDAPRWVRVAVPALDLSSLSPDASAQIEDPEAGRATRPPIVASPAAAAPSTASPQQGTVDRYFVLPERAAVGVGQVVAVWLAGRDRSEVPVIAADALIHDASGATWVYERTGEQVFSRRHVDVVRIDEGLAVLSPSSLQPRGLHVGSTVVTAGAMELYGAEFGSGK